MPEKIDANLVEVLDNGEVMFEGRLVSPAELIVGTVLCGLKKADEIDTDNKDQISEGVEETRYSASQAAAASSSSSSFGSSKRRKYHYTSITLPEDDVRLSYSKTYFDAINSADSSLVLKMLREIGTPNIVLVNRKLIPDPDFLLPNHFEIIGPEAIAASCAQLNISFPDVVCTVLNHSIHIYANGESLIECNVVCNLTKIFEVEGLPAGSNEKLIVNSVADGNVQLSSKIVSRVDSSDGIAVSVPVIIGAAKEEKVHTIKSKLSMHLNSNHKIFLVIIANE